MDDLEEEYVNELYLHYKTKFRSTRIIGDTVYPTNFTLKADVWLDMEELSQEDKDFHLNLTLIKIDFFFRNIVDNSVMLSSSNSWASDTFFKDGKPVIDNNIISCPSEPSDDHLAMLFQSKMTSLSKEYVVFGGIKLTSDNSRGLSFTFVGDGANTLPDIVEWVGEVSYFEEPWWMRDDASTYDIIPTEDADLTQKPDFAFDLDFLGQSLKPINSEHVTNNVVRPSFRPKIIRNEDE